jgi:hypothetical protein
MKGQDDEAVEQRPHPVVGRKPMQEQGTRDRRPIGEIRHGIGHQQREAVVYSGPQKENRGKKDCKDRDGQGSAFAQTRGAWLDCQGLIQLQASFEEADGIDPMLAL